MKPSHLNASHEILMIATVLNTKDVFTILTVIIIISAN